MHRQEHDLLCEHSRLASCYLSTPNTFVDCQWIKTLNSISYPLSFPSFDLPFIFSRLSFWPRFPSPISESYVRLSLIRSRANSKLLTKR